MTQTTIQLNLEIIDSPSQLAPLMEWLDSLPVQEIGLDLETNVTETLFTKKIRTIQIGNREKQFVIDLRNFSEGKIEEQGWFKTPEWAKPLLSIFDKIKFFLKLGHYVQFEYECLYWCLGIRIHTMYCTMLVEKILNAGRLLYKQEGNYGLEDVVLKRCNYQMDKKWQTSFTCHDDLCREQYEYAALDTRVLFAVRKSQLKEVDAIGLNKIVQVENDAIPFFGDLGCNGFYLDRDIWLKTVDFYKEKHKKNIAKLDSFFIPVVGRKKSEEELNLLLEEINVAEQAWRSENKCKTKRAELREVYRHLNKSYKELLKAQEKYEGEAAINYGAPGQTLEAFAKMGIKLKDTNDNTLSLALNQPAIKALQDCRATAKIISTYGVKWLNKADPTTGLIHSNINQIGAETGRTSSSSPNIANIPHNEVKGEPNFHAAFTARSKDRTLVIADLAGAELRILAEMSQYKLFLDAFNNNEDVHSIGAEIIYGAQWWASQESDCLFRLKKQKCNCTLHKKLRNQVKAINFGIAYGMAAKKLASELSIEVHEAQELLDKYVTTFDGLIKFLTYLGSKVKQEHQARDIAGRIRYFQKPTYERAKELVLKEKEKREKEGYTYNVTPNKIKQKYTAMFAAMEREGRNMPIQSLNATILKTAVGSGHDPEGKPYLWHTLQQYDALFVNTVYDEVVIDCPIEHAELVRSLVEDAFLRAGREYMKSVSMESESVINFAWMKN